MVQKKSISVIQPNYNGKHLLEQYLPSVFEALNFSDVDFEIIIIDDCSKDDSVNFIKTAFPSVKLLVNKVNAGFSITCNRGIMQASKELIFLLNSDVKLSRNYFEEQFKYFTDEQTFGVMGCIMNFDNQKMEDAARLPYYKGGKFKANKFYFIENDHQVFTTYLSGANALIDRKKLLLLDGFDTIYSPFYFEDFDLGLRAWRMGWKLWYEHQSVCCHQVSSSTNQFKKGNFVKIIYNRNSFILQSIHLPAGKKFFWYLQLFTTTLIGHILKGEFWILKSLHYFLKQKSKIRYSKLKFEILQQKGNTVYRLNDVISIINSSISNKNVKWL